MSCCKRTYSMDVVKFRIKNICRGGELCVKNKNSGSMIFPLFNAASMSLMQVVGLEPSHWSFLQSCNTLALCWIPEKLVFCLPESSRGFNPLTPTDSNTFSELPCEALSLFRYSLILTSESYEVEQSLASNLSLATGFFLRSIWLWFGAVGCGDPRVKHPWFEEEKGLGPPGWEGGSLLPPPPVEWLKRLLPVLLAVSHHVPVCS